jgi:hypothetical protein
MTIDSRWQIDQAYSPSLGDSEFRIDLFLVSSPGAQAFK